MKKLFLKLMILSALFTLTLPAGAQNAKLADFALEGTAGVTFSTYSAGINLNGTGFRVGVLGEKDFAEKPFYYNVGAMLSLERCSFSAWNISCNPFFLNVPFHLGYKYELSEEFTLFGEAGPFVGLGLFGNVKYSGYNDDEDEPSSIFIIEKAKSPVFGGEDGWRRFQLGLGLKAGAAYKRYKFFLGWDFNLLSTLGDGKTSHNCGVLGVSYLF